LRFLHGHGVRQSGLQYRTAARAVEAHAACANGDSSARSRARAGPSASSSNGNLGLPRHNPSSARPALTAIGLGALFNASSNGWTAPIKAAVFGASPLRAVSHSARNAAGTRLLATEISPEAPASMASAALPS